MCPGIPLSPARRDPAPLGKGSQPGDCGACPLQGDSAALARWPGLGQLTVTIGGVTLAADLALDACQALASSGSCAIRSVLAASRSPLAHCDYHAAYRPGYQAALAEIPPTHRPGGAGRHAAKRSFISAVVTAVRQACCQSLAQALQEMASDERYAVAVASSAIAAGALGKS